MLKIIPELENLFPPLEKNVFEGLEKDICENGCKQALIIWDGIIVDGHNRYTICQKHDIPFKTETMEFDSVDQAQFWAWKQQEFRRNLTSYQRTKLALKFKPMIAEQAREMKVKGGKEKGKNKKKQLPQNSGEAKHGTETMEQLAKMAGVSRDTVSRVEFLEKHADEATKEKLGKGETSINKEYTRVKAETKTAESTAKKTRKPRKIKTVDEIDLTPASVKLSNAEAEQAEADGYTPPPVVTSPGGLVPHLTLNLIPENDPERLIACLFSLFPEKFVLDLIPALCIRLNKNEDGPQKVRVILAELNKIFP